MQNLVEYLDLPLPDGAVHFAFSDQLIEHLHPDDTDDHFRTIYRLLKPGGMLIARDVLRGGADAADALARFHQALAEDERLVSAVLPVDGGLALATVR